MSREKTAGRKGIRPLRVIIAVIVGLLLIVIGYVAYVFIAYHRIPDGQELSPFKMTDPSAPAPKPGERIKIVSFNTGFGAYEPDYSFFMDGGTESWAWSKERLEKNMDAMSGFLRETDADILLLQEVDTDSTRTYHVNEQEIIKAKLPGYDSIYAVNWDSPFLLYPLTQPHGKSLSGILAMSRYPIAGGIRRSLPVEDSVMKIVDLDRCYSRSYIPVGEKELVVYNVHLSAYTSDGTVADRQLEMLIADMEEEYSKGNYVICGGDFNKDLLGDSSQYFGIKGDDYTWAQPIKTSILDGKPFTLVTSSNAPSCRVADAPYNKDQFVLLLDGFIISDNVTAESSTVLDTAFAYSDHNPVEGEFVLEP